MKNYKVEAIKNFTDKLENEKRTVGDEFDTTKERYEFLKSKGAVKLIRIIEEVVDKVVEEVLSSKEIEKAIDEAVDEIVDKIIPEKPKKKKSKKK